MEHVSVRKEEKNGRRKKKEGDGVLRAVSKAEKERHGLWVGWDEEDTAGIASPGGEGHRIVRARGIPERYGPT